MNRTRDDQRDPGLLAAIAAAKGLSPIAAACGITVQAVADWKRVPPHQVITVECLTGIPRERLRPDLYGAPRPRPRRRTPIEAAA